MRQGTVNDASFIQLVLKECDLPELDGYILDSRITYVGEHGFFLLDQQSEDTAIVHVAILPQGRGLWGELFFSSMLEWAFTHTKIDRINAMIPTGDKHVRRFAAVSGLRLVHETDIYAYYDIDIFRWTCVSPSCLRVGTHAMSDFSGADQEMVKRVTGACAMMNNGGMEHKAWYIYNLYAKLFGYRSEE